MTLPETEYEKGLREGRETSWLALTDSLIRGEGHREGGDKMSCPRCMEAGGLCEDCEKYLYPEAPMIDKERIARLEAENAELRLEHDDAQEQIAGMGNAIGVLKQRAETAEYRVMQQNRVLEEKESALKRLEATLAEREKEIERLRMNLDMAGACGRDFKLQRDDLRSRLAAARGALRRLRNETHGFIAMADVNNHGYTNTRILHNRLDEADAALAETEDQ